MLIGVDANEANVKNRVGSGTHAFELLKQFAELATSKHQFEIFLKEKPLEDLPKENQNFKYKVFGPKKLWTQFALPLRLLGNKPDVFFSMTHYGPRFSRVPNVVTIYDLSYLHYPELFNKDDLYQLKSWSKYSIEGAKHIIAISQSTKDDIIKNYGVSPSKISVTYMGYDQKLFKPQNKSKIDNIKKKYKIGGDYIIFVGTLQPRKNIERLIEAFAEVNSKIPDVELMIAGKKGWLFEPIFEKVKKLNLEKEIIFTDYVPDDDLPPLIAGAKVYILPSLWEGFGIPVIEAQACGVPVSVSETSSLPEVVDKSGFTFDPEKVPEITSSLLVLLTDDKLRSMLIEKGFKNVKRFSWEKCAKETLKILVSV
ncbi:MAG: glycosyltransferase family 4 protein [Candidatus Curtissbacteria bacterium]|nr:glycosyltransferase family 4 protein [Candidatus Curtissbacteria bacterium]